ncbi:hypothetical protein [Hymenobacter aerophilus]|uniref:hypothetical protein n=1 Tax=Hymenobacter aerophilus TaxID=119644 RepID=UPI0003627342|nr:hypothetical protein [Hymenobacter aerophilus]
MPYYLPDAESLQEIFGEYMARGLQFDVLRVKPYQCYGLRVQTGPGRLVAPLFWLQPQHMQTPEMAQQWLEQVRDTQLAAVYPLG